MPPQGNLTATPNPVQSGGSLKICVDDATQANQTITVTMDNGETGAGACNDSKQLTLDANGHGCFNWVVPATGWDIIQINAPNCTQETVFVSP